MTAPTSAQAAPGGWRSAAWPLLACLAWLLATSWVRPLMAPDEGRYAGVALSMLHSGDWLVPRLDGLPFFHKPPLFYWIAASVMAVAGPVEWAARVPSVIGAMLGAGALFLFLRRWSTPAQARLSLTVLATMPFFFIGAQFANLDMLVAGCIAAAVLAAAWTVLAQEQGQPWRGALAAAYALAAAGLLAKGLIGIVLPGLIFIGWCAATRRFARLRIALWLPGWALLLVIAGPWFVAMQLRFPAFFDYFVITQHFRRFASTGFNNAHAVWFYLPVIAGLTVPWSLWAGAAFRKKAQGEGQLTDLDRLMLVWLAVIVVFFSLPQSKLIGYVLPALPPLAYGLARVLLCGPALRGVRATAWASAAICIASVVAVTVYATPPGARLKLPVGTRVPPDARVLMVGTYFYEIPFYWKLQKPVLIEGDWASPDIAHHDNWRKEVADAAQFDSARAAQVLVAPQRLSAALCVPQPTWVVGPSNASIAYPWLHGLTLVAVNDQAAVWRFDGSAGSDPQCIDTAPPQCVGPASACNRP